MHELTSRDLACYIEHTLLKPEATKKDLAKLCEETLHYRFRAVCVNSANVAFCASRLASYGITVVAVVGFPFGAALPEVKAHETLAAINAGAHEIDMVMNVGALRDGDYTAILNDIVTVVTAAGIRKVKVIIETGLLNTNEKIAACVLSKTARAAFVTTCTGFGPGCATSEDISLMKQIVGPKIGVKASDGIKTAKTARAMIAAGATRIGTSASVSIVEGNS